MNTLVKFVISNINTLLIVALLIVVAIIVFKVLKKLKLKHDDEMQQQNPLEFGIEHVGSFFKVKKVEEEKGIIFLAFNPSTNYPSGSGGAWFSINFVPLKAREEYAVLKIEAKLEGGIKCVESHPF